MRIAQVAPLWARVPPETYGGTERIVHLLTEDLVRRGHEVTLFASGDSRTSARLRSVCQRNLFEAMARGEVRKPEYYQLSNLMEALRAADEFDIIHCHVGCYSLPFDAICRTPILHTVPTMLKPDDFWLLERFPEPPVIARSWRQVAAVRKRGAFDVIYNGCDFGQFGLAEAPGRYLAFLGRMGADKNPAGAIRLAHQAGLPIVLAGEPWYPGEDRYFREHVEPLIDGKQVKYIGPVNNRQKKEFLQQASVFVFPIQWEEAFGNVMIEAMACGVPVVAFNRGSVSEVVDYGQTGFYADAEEDLPELIRRAMALDRRTVYEQARRRFTHTRMVDDYLRRYESLATERRLSTHGTS